MEADLPARIRGALAKFGPLLVLNIAILFARRDWVGLVGSPLAAALVLGCGYLYGRFRRRTRRTEIEADP